MDPNEIKNIKVRDIILIKAPGPLLFGKVVHVTDYDLVHIDIRIVWKPLNRATISYNNTWDYHFVKNYVERIIDDPSTLRLIRSLYD